MTKPVVLASASPRRRELLEQAGLKFLVDPAEIDEKPPVDGDFGKMAVSLSLAKAMSARHRHPGAIIIAADTFGVLEGRLLGKPVDEVHACQMLAFMSGKCHEVITGFTVLDSDSGRAVSRAVSTMVWFKVLSVSQIDRYVSSGEPLDKAGSYAIQGLGAELVERIEGDYYNVVGLPLRALSQELKKFGVELPEEP